MSEKKDKKIRFLETSLEIRDVIIRWLIVEVSKNKLQLPKELIDNIVVLYGIDKEKLIPEKEKEVIQ